MDIQLPVMDGIEATQRIRAIEKEQKTGKLPRQTVTDEPSVFRSPVIIVALTASSLASDREAALSAGCNDFLTKPVDLVWLEKKIIEWGCMQALIDFDSWRKWKRSEGVEPKSTTKPVAPAALPPPPPKADGSATTPSVALSPSRSSDSSAARKGVLLPGASGIKRRPSSAAEDTTKTVRRPLSRHNSEPQIQLHEANIKPSVSHDTRTGTLSPIKEASGSSDGSVQAMSDLAIAEMLQQQQQIN
jgi:osomolarity two-component system, response regulator SSK1